MGSPVLSEKFGLPYPPVPSQTLSIVSRPYDSFDVKAMIMNDSTYLEAFTKFLLTVAYEHSVPDFCHFIPGTSTGAHRGWETGW